MSSNSLRERALFEFIRHGARVIDGPGRRFVNIDSRGLIKAAQRRTGLRNFGDDAFREPLQRLVDSLESEAQLSFVGRLAAREDVTRLLINRLKVQRDRERHPQIAAECIRRPLVITGLPRTGSTLLHGLLAQDPANRVPRTWETMYPSPPPERATSQTDPRADVAERQLQWFHRLAPGFMQIHPVGARLPEECVIIMSHTLASFQFSTSFFVPSYQRWLDEQDLTATYRYHYTFLQHLQWRHAGQRWVLKAPSHLPGLSALCAVYPDAGIIMTHRDPLEVVASVASLHVTCRRAFSDAVDPCAVGPEVSALLAGDIERGMRARDASDEQDRFVDVWYPELVRDPIAVVRRIYKHFDLGLDGDATMRMQRFLSDQPQDKYGYHDYSLAAFGLEADTERRRYHRYCSRFGLQ